MKIWKIAVITTLVAALVLGVALPGLADSGTTATVTNTGKAWGKPFPRIIRGEVIDIGDRLFVIQTGEREATIYVTEDTKYFIIQAPFQIPGWLPGCPALEAAESPVPAPLNLQFGLPQARKGKPDEAPAFCMPRRLEFAPNLYQSGGGQNIAQQIRTKLHWFHRHGKKATFDDLAIGDKVGVLLVPGNNDSLTAEAEERLTAQVVFIIRPSVWERVSGTIERLSDDTIVIEPIGGGDAVSLGYDESTTFILKGFTSVEVEQFARAVYNTETMVARLVKVWPEAPPAPLPIE